MHLLGVIVPLAYAGGVSRTVIAASLAALSAIAVSLELARAHSRATSALFDRCVGPLLRECEQREWSGATWMLLAFLGVTLFFAPPVAIVAMWAVAVGDACAALIGRWLGRHRVGAGKSVEGSAACFVTTLAGALMVAHLGAGASIVAATAAAAAEWPHEPLDDNLRIAVAVGCAVTLWRMVLA